MCRGSHPQRLFWPGGLFSSAVEQQAHYENGHEFRHTSCLLPAEGPLEMVHAQRRF